MFPLQKCGSTPDDPRSVNAAGKEPSHRGLMFVFLGVSLSSSGATFLCTLPVPLSVRVILTRRHEYSDLF